MFDLSSPAVKRYRAGTDRAAAPEETLARAMPHMAALGITRLATLTGLDRIGLPVVAAYRPNARALSVAQGKGLDLPSARASALMEALEVEHAERADLPLRLGSARDLGRRYRLADLGRLPRARRASIHADLPLAWAEGHDLLAEEPAWVPYELVHCDYTLPMRRMMAGLAASSSGLASGNHPLEALSHAICELVERDATTLWRLRSAAARARTRVDPSSVDDPRCRAVLERYAQAEVGVLIWEISSDIGIPAFLVRIFDLQDSPMRPRGVIEGMGCHPTRAIALLRALTEAAQGRVTLIAGARDDCPPARYAQHWDVGQSARMRAELRAGRAPRSFQEAPSFDAPALGDDLAWELGRLRAAGLEQVIALDLTRPEVGVPVVRVIIPGLEPLDDGQLALGRRARAARRGAR